MSQNAGYPGDLTDEQLAVIEGRAINKHWGPGRLKAAQPEVLTPTKRK